MNLEKKVTFTQEPEPIDSWHVEQSQMMEAAGMANPFLEGGSSDLLNEFSYQYMSD